MGFFSKLFKSEAKDAVADAAPEGESPRAPTEQKNEEQKEEKANVDAAPAARAGMIATPLVMMPYVPPAARPTPIDAFERATVVHDAPLVAEERPTLVALVIPAVAPDVAHPLGPHAPIAKAKPPPLPAQARKTAPHPVPHPVAPTASLPIRDSSPMPIREEDIEASFTALERTSDRPPRLGTLRTDMNEVRTLFGELATDHMRQVRDFMIELRWGDTATTWLLVCEPAIGSLLRAAEALEFEELARGLRELANAMQMALEMERAGTAMIEGEARARLLAAHAELERILPETFALASEKSQREAAILHALLSQIPDVHKVTIDKLYAAGLTTLETMFLARTDDLVATTGISDVLAARIVERFRAYREEIAKATVDETRAYERGKIAALVAELQAVNVEFDAAAAAWTEEARQRKKELLLGRAKTMLAIDLQLARLGEIALVRELERLPFAHKLSRLIAFMRDASDKYARSAS